jgi:hypothetical protein
MEQGVIDSNEKVVHLKKQGILSSFNGIDIDQRREYGKVFCQFYLARTLKTHGWYKSSATEKSHSRPIDLLAASTTDELFTSVRPVEDITELLTPTQALLARYHLLLTAIVNHTNTFDVLSIEES